jgi:hypothetical protein
MRARAPSLVGSRESWAASASIAGSDARRLLGTYLSRGDRSDAALSGGRR